MQVNVNIQIGPGDTVPRRSPARIATEVMQALDADPEQDTVYVTINASGSVGGAALPTAAPND